MISKLLTVKDIAPVLGTTEARTYELIRLGILPAVRIGRQVRVSEDQLKAWIATGGRELPGGWRRDV